MKRQSKINNQSAPPDSITGSTYVGYWKIVLKSNKLSLCPRVRKILELTKTDDQNLSRIFSLIQPGYLRKLIHEFKAACFNGTKFDKQIRVITPEGNEKWLHIAGTLYYRRWGTAEQMFGTIEDVTQKVNEECLSMAIVNHELRAPLTIIKLNTQCLINHLSHSPNSNPVRLLNIVDQHVNGMTRLIEEYLSSSIDDHRIAQLNFSLFDMHQLVDIVINEMRTLYPSHRFYKANDGYPALVTADKYKIIQVLINYLTNAVKFSPAGSQISINVLNQCDKVEVAVMDRGVGINQNQEQQLFQKFYRCNHKETRQKNSKGLGLYIVKNIIEKHGGTVRAEKGKETGAVFYFTLPSHAQIKYTKVICEELQLMD